MWAAPGHLWLQHQPSLWNQGVSLHQGFLLILSLSPDYHFLHSLCEPSSRTAWTKALVKSDLLRVHKTPTDGFTLMGFWRVSAEFCSHFLCRQNFFRRGCLLMDSAVASSVWPHGNSCRGGFSDPCDRGYLPFQGHARAAGLARCLSTRFIYNESLWESKL